MWPQAQPLTFHSCYFQQFWQGLPKGVKLSIILCKVRKCRDLYKGSHFAFINGSTPSIVKLCTTTSCDVSILWGHGELNFVSKSIIGEGAIIEDGMAPCFYFVWQSALQSSSGPSQTENTAGGASIECRHWLFLNKITCQWQLIQNWCSIYLFIYENCYVEGAII